MANYGQGQGPCPVGLSDAGGRSNGGRVLIRSGLPVYPTVARIYFRTTVDVSADYAHTKARADASTRADSDGSGLPIELWLDLALNQSSRVLIHRGPMHEPHYLEGNVKKPIPKGEYLATLADGDQTNVRE